VFQGGEAPKEKVECCKRRRMDSVKESREEGVGNVVEGEERPSWGGGTYNDLEEEQP